MVISEVAPRSKLFEAVVDLWRHHSATLGFMPSGGFDDAARSGLLLAAVIPDGSLAGYIMFRRTQRNVAIVHLCVSKQHRGAGVARRLFEAVKVRCADSYELRVRCRRDFD